MWGGRSCGHGIIACIGHIEGRPYWLTGPDVRQLLVAARASTSRCQPHYDRIYDKPHQRPSAPVSDESQNLRGNQRPLTAAGGRACAPEQEVAFRIARANRQARAAQTAVGNFVGRLRGIHRFMPDSAGTTEPGKQKNKAKLELAGSSPEIRLGRLQTSALPLGYGAGCFILCSAWIGGRR
jgi:hypothetical protein